MIYFTADIHFGHARIIDYCDRPFNNADEMDRVLIKNWNSVVGSKDVVYILGDLTLHREKQRQWLETKVRKLNTCLTSIAELEVIINDMKRAITK